MDNFDVHEFLPGSNRSPFPGDHAGRPHPEQEVQVLLHLRRPRTFNLTEIINKRQFFIRGAIEQVLSASQADIDLVFGFVNRYNLEVLKVDRIQRMVTVTGTIEDLEKAFRVHLALRRQLARVIRVRSGALMIPRELTGIVIGVFGLDDRPQASPHMRTSLANIGLPFKPKAFDGNQLAQIYNFPPGDGSGQTIGIIELGGGYRKFEIEAFFHALGLPMPTLKDVSVANAHNQPGVDRGADIEVALDIEVAGAVAPNTTIVVYFAPNTDKGFLQAILAAVHDGVNRPSILTISWGAAEINWTEQSLAAMNDAFQTAALMGISVFCAAGDDGANDRTDNARANVDFPASSPFATACGGTKLVIDASNQRIETAWNEDKTGEGATGGGVSDVFERPEYQQTLSVPRNLGTGKAGRALPDVSAVADPVTGYAVFCNASWNIIGGTSAVAPLFAGLLARINQQHKAPSGLINTALYQAGMSNGFNDITIGDNTYGGTKGYSSSIGWDPVTGWGTPGGKALMDLLAPPPPSNQGTKLQDGGGNVQHG